MSDLREKIARTLHECDCVNEGGCRSWEMARSEVHRVWYRERADAVLAVLPSEGWEQVGWRGSRGLNLWGMDLDVSNLDGMEPVYRRVDGAAPRAGGVNVSDLIESAWGLLANVSGGNWEEQEAEWQEAVKRWRSRYHAHLDDLRDGAAPPEPKGHACEMCDATVRACNLSLRLHGEPCCGACAHRDTHGLLRPASSTPTEVERLREALTLIRDRRRGDGLPSAHDIATAALSGQQDTTEAHDG